MNPSTARGRRVLTFLVAAVAAACSTSDPFTSPTPANTTPIIETFAGTLTKNGAASYSFVATTAGLVTATLSSVVPDNTIPIGLALGTWNGLTCQIVLPNDNTLQGAGVTGSVNTAGSLCVRVYDVGNIADPLTYEVKVQHL
jgi:hypothetical protein